ncbi:MAG: hypothetical protein AAGC57_03400 [Pseudomonadota bacterium]
MSIEDATVLNSVCKAVGPATLDATPRDAEHQQMGEIILSHLTTVDAAVTDNYGNYWTLGNLAQIKSKRMLKWAAEAGVSLAKLKAKNAVGYLEKMLA